MNPDQFENTPFALKSDDGLTLFSRIYGAHLKNEALPVVCLSGLSRNSRDFHQLAIQIVTDPVKPRMVICPDYRGRGLSGRDSNPENYNLFRETQDIDNVLQALDITKAHFIGTSRGGLIMHLMPGFGADRIASIILNDIGPEIDLEGMIQIRNVLSARPEPADWQQAARAMKATYAEGFPALDDEDWSDMAAAIFTDRDGSIRPDFDPELVAPLRRMDLSQPPPDLWPQFETLRRYPLLVIRGENSRLLSESTVAEMKKRMPALEVFTAPGQAHAPILHKHGPERVIAAFYRDRP